MFDEDEPAQAKRGLTSEARCACGAVRMEIVVPAVWAWHDHGAASRLAQGCAYATYVGSWKSRFRIIAGEEMIGRYEDAERRTTRSFCKACGTPVAYERESAPKMINIPRALFLSRTGREPRYHLNLDEMPDWTYLGARLGPLKGYPGVAWERPKARKKRVPEGM